MVLQALPGVIFWAEVAATGIRARESAINSPLKNVPLIPITEEYLGLSTYPLIAIHCVTAAAIQITRQKTLNTPHGVSLPFLA